MEAAIVIGFMLVAALGFIYFESKDRKKWNKLYEEEAADNNKHKLHATKTLRILDEVNRMTEEDPQTHFPVPVEPTPADWERQGKLALEHWRVRP